MRIILKKYFINDLFIVGFIISCFFTFHSKAENETSWKTYLENAETVPVKNTLFEALKHIKVPSGEHPFAIDLGCGAGSDTVFLLSKGWEVLCVDLSFEAIKATLRRAEKIGKGSMLQTINEPFENVDLKKYPQVDLINASYSLPYTDVNQFPEFWQRLKNQLKRGGYFAGHLFGIRHSFCEPLNLVCLTRNQISDLFNDFKIISIEETEEDEHLASSSQPKHEHVFHVVAQKN